MNQYGKRIIETVLLYIIAVSSTTAQTVLEEIVVTATKRGEVSV